MVLFGKLWYILFGKLWYCLVGIQEVQFYTNPGADPGEGHPEATPPSALDSGST